MSDADKENPAESASIKALLSAAQRGYRTVLSLKFVYFKQAIPTAGSGAMATASRRLDDVLAAVLDKVDILVIGNEPFIECQDADRGSDRLNEFYETLARQAIAYRDRNGGKTRLYMGALNHLDQADWRTGATDRWMTFVRDTQALDGTDLHPHLPDVAAGQAYLDYVVPRLRAGQKFLATEFSLVLFWKKHLKDPVAPAFAKKYGVATGTPVWQVIKSAIANPFPQEKWTDFLSMSHWFSANQTFLADQVKKFRDTGRLAVAAYGIAQDTPMIDGFGPDSPPWLLNSLFCPYTVQAAADGLPGQTTPWVDQFRALQQA
ncbi:hypothetical protein FPZ12_023865 [Amycolatopsis acidicola]|uniref:Uncharacterized protein n=2 Tax=Amycolatopsis acidicola TaxID=2596893 RepID=A0A5N0UX76_9PSEU|nr:hypothetical protein FPZ12_023865 [Amycolatopsis acidicola]